MNEPNQPQPEAVANPTAPPPAAAGPYRWRWLWSPLLPLAAMALFATASLVRKSATYDESAILAGGACYLRWFDFGVNAENPPLLKALYALPLVAAAPDLKPPPDSVHFSYRMQDGIQYGNDLLFGQPQPHRLLVACRLMVVAMALGLGILLYAVARRLWDSRTAVILLWVFAFCPNLLAHARLITPDVGCTFFVFAATVTLYQLLARGRPVDALLHGLALGGALAAKFTGVILIPLIPLQAVLFLVVTKRWRDWKRVTLGLLASGVVALLLVNALYGFRGGFGRLRAETYRSPLVQSLQRLPVVADLPLPVPAAYVRGFDIVAYNNRPGFPAIFLGEIYPLGGSWWYYYLVVMGLKVPLPLLAGMLLGAALLWRLRRSLDWAAITVLAVPPLLLFWNFSFVAYRQLGFRYILPLWPFLLLLVGLVIHNARQQATIAARVGLAILAAWYVLASCRTFPDYLSYFNELAGGSRNGWRYLAAADVDWGEDLPALAAWQKQHGNPSMYVMYYGTAPLEAYGVRAVPWGTLPFPQYLAISVTSYYLCYKIPLVTFLRQERQPVAVLGNSIHVYALDQELTRQFMQKAMEAAREPGGDGSPDRPLPPPK